MVKFIVEHVDDFLQILGAVVALATLIVKLTPTQKDDTVLSKVIKVLVALSLCNEDGTFVSNNAKEK